MALLAPQVVLTDTPQNLIAAGTYFNSAPLIIGHNREEVRRSCDHVSMLMSSGRLCPVVLLDSVLLRSLSNFCSVLSRLMTRVHWIK